jgi:HlyD family secretion protein
MKIRHLLLVGFLLVAVVSGYAYWRRTGGEENGGYVTEPVSRGDITAVVTATGTVNPVTLVQVGTYVSGPIIAIDVDFNSPVRTGQRVAQIDPAPFLVKVRRAEANLATARARAERARADLGLKALLVQRNRELRQKKVVSQTELDTTESEYEQARAQLALEEATVAQAEAELEEARINLAYTDITSPVDGVVVSRAVDVGQTVAASFQTPTLFQIAQDLTKMQVNASVSEADIGAVADGQPAHFTVDAYPGREFAGTVVQVRNAPVTIQNVVTYDVIVGVDNSSLELKPGMTASVTITTAERADTLRVPIRALSFNPPPPSADGAPRPPVPTLSRRGTAPAVWRLDPGGTLARLEIQTGLRDDQFAEVLSGDLHPGEAVVVALRRSETRPPAPSLPGMPRRR